MTNHVYQFNNIIRKQSTGGPIGLDLTGDLAQVFMSWWDKELLCRIEQEDNLSVLMYKRYVDDINVIIKILNDQQRHDENQQKPLDQLTMERLKQIGDSIHSSNKLEADFPSNHTDSKLPLLDIKMWVEKKENSKVRIMHEFFQKEVSSKLVVHARSSLPWTAKRTVLTQEILRVLLRCSPDLSWEITKTHVEDFLLRIQFSGYTIKFQAEVLKSAIAAYREIQKEDCQGNKPIYRPNSWKRKERQENRREKKTKWYQIGGNLKSGLNEVLFVLKL